MNWFKNLTVGKKLFLGFSVMILLTASIGFTGYRSTANINQNVTDIFNVRLPSIDYLIEADRDLQQLLVAERSMIFANSKSDLFKSLVKEYEDNLKQADERWEKYKALPATPEEQAIMPKYEQARDEWKKISRQVVDGRISDSREGRRMALDLTLGIAKEKFEAMRNYIDQLTVINLKMAQKTSDAADDTYRTTLISLITITGIGLLSGLFIMWRIGSGTTGSLKKVISGLTMGADQVGSAAAQVSAASQSLAEGSSEQAASLEETSSSLEEMASMTKQNAQNAGMADRLMQEANTVVENANGSMTQLTSSMEDISKASEETSKIIKTIDEIAFQTNLLALNAAVEAARAGEAGAGFAVVADEVRNLALRAADAAKDTANLIEGTVKRVKDGSMLVNTTSEAFTEVAASATKVGELISEIAAASSEQSLGIEQVNVSVTETDKVTQQNAATAEESASASEELNSQAEQMKVMVNALVGMVQNRKNKSVLRRKPSKAVKKPQLMAPAVRQTPAPAPIPRLAKEVTPGQLIPLEDDDDFKDF